MKFGVDDKEKREDVLSFYGQFSCILYIFLFVSGNVLELRVKEMAHSHSTRIWNRISRKKSGFDPEKNRIRIRPNFDLKKTFSFDIKDDVINILYG